MAKRSAFYALSACLVAACSSNPFQPSDINNSVFNTPELFIDQEVRLCGFVLDRFENGNILTSKPTTPDPPLAIGFIAARDRHEPSRYDGKMACVQGTIIRTGCGKEIICSWSRHEFALRETRAVKQ